MKKLLIQNINWKNKEFKKKYFLKGKDKIKSGNTKSVCEFEMIEMVSKDIFFNVLGTYCFEKWKNPLKVIQNKVDPERENP